MIIFASLIAFLIGIGTGALLFSVYMKPKHVKQFSKKEAQLLNILNTVAMAHDIETGNHILRTQHYVRLIAERLKQSNAYPGLIPANINNMYLAASLHDIGKIGIPQHILKKVNLLSDEEWKIMKTHTTIGEEIINAIRSANPQKNDVIEFAFQIVGGHHERWDGSGYPRGLKGKEIPLAARIMALADIYDALVNERVYKKSWSHEDAMAYIVSNKGVYFDPSIVDAFLREQVPFQKISTSYKDN